MGYRQIFALGFALGILFGHADISDARSVAQPQVPLAFEANAGQTDSDVTFLARGAGYGIVLSPTSVVVGLRPEQAATSASLRISLPGARPDARLAGLDELPGKANYFIGNDPARWRRDVPMFARVRALSVYPGVDVVYYGNDARLEFDFVVAPGADPGVIALGVEGADSIDVASDGDVVIHMASGSLRLQKPVIYQDIDGARREIEGTYRRDGPNRVRFHVAAYDAGRPLVIDPVLTYSSYLAGSASDRGWGVAVDSAGFVYFTGYTMSWNFPLRHAMQPWLLGGMDAFVTKLTPDGRLIYSTFLGGSQIEFGLGIAADALGNAYVTGFTGSADFPTLNPVQKALRGPSDVFVTKLDRGGALVYSTFLGGSATEVGYAIGVDAHGSAVVAGVTFSVDFPVLNALQPTFGGQRDAFVAKLDPSGAALIYSTYLGGSGEDEARDVAVDADGSAYLAGGTASANFPLFQPAQGTFGGAYDAFVAKLDPKGAPRYSTFLGGSGFDFGYGIAIDRWGQAYVTGSTSSINFPTVNPLQSALSGTQDAFVAKLDEAGASFRYATYLGGSGWEDGRGVAVDRRGNAYIVGATNSTNLATANAIQSSFGGGFSDGFVAKVDATGSTLLYATYLGGSDTDLAYHIAIDAERNLWITGETASYDFPTTPTALQPAYGGSVDAFMTRITEVLGYVANNGNATVSTFDVATNVPAPPMPLGPGPWGVALTPDGTLAFVTDAYVNLVHVVETGTSTPLSPISVASPSMGVAISPDGSLAFVTDLYASSVSVIDVASKAVINTVPVGAWPVGVAFAPDGATAYVANAGDNSVSVLAIWRFPWFTWVFEIARIPVGQTPYGVAVSPQGFVVYVTNLGANSVSVIDTTRLVEVARTPVGTAPRGVAMRPTGTRAYVANSGSNDVSVLDTLTHAVIATINVGYAPEGAAVSPGATRVYVTNLGSGSVSVIDAATNTVVATPPVGPAPAGIAVTP